MGEYGISPASIALFARKITDESEFNDLSKDEREECIVALHCAADFVRSYTGLGLSYDDLEKTGDPYLSDVCYAIKVLAAEMIDNHQVTAQYTGKNPLVYQILDLHSTNLLPSVEG
ncbi:MAG: hypothetical protein SO072_07615 [Dysosmobacter sp.]|nr:hypothetical protein [Dysosmobacter sp.]